MLIPEQAGGPGFDVIGWFSMLHRRFAYARLSDPYMTRSMPRLLTMTFTTAVFCPKQLMAVWSLLLQGDSEGPSFISRTA